MRKKLLALLLCALLLLPGALAEEAAPILEVHQLVLGYADGYFIRCGDIEIMIDGGKTGPGASGELVLAPLRELGATQLDAYIVTHWHLDHCGNVNDILEAFGTADTLVFSPSPRVFKDFAPLTAGEYVQMKMDDVVTIGPLKLTCVGPENGGRFGNTNPDSLNFMLEYGTRRMLFTGDYANSRGIFGRYADFCRDVDLLKFPHHGGEPYEIKPGAVDVTNPDYVLVPSMLNPYKIWRYMQDCGADTLQENVLTQRAGHIVVLTDGGGYFEVLIQQNPADYAPKVNESPWTQLSSDSGVLFLQIFNI